MGGEGGPVGGGIAAAPAGKPSVIEMANAHGLGDGDLVRISTATGPKECYVKASGQSSNAFSPYEDAPLAQPSEVNGIVAGDTVERLNAEDWAIIAGINYYPAFTNLRGPVNDAKEFERWTLRRGFVPKDQVKFVSGPGEPPRSLEEAMPTRDQLGDRFQELVDAASSKKYHRLGRRLYVFLSGHGIVATLASIPDYREAALLMANAGAKTLGRHIGARAHAEWFRALGVFDEVVLIADCCRDLEDNVPPAIPDLPKWRPQRPAGRPFYAFPTMLGSKAFERGFGNPETVRGIFSYVVVDALNNSKLYNAQGALPASVLEKHLYITVPNLTGKQNPIVEYLHDGDDIIFAKWFHRDRQKIEIKFDPPCPGGIADLFRGVGSGKPLDSSPSDQAWSDDLDAGFLYKVAIRGTNRSRLFEVTGNDEVQIVTV
jgi:hypothetical protein